MATASPDTAAELMRTLLDNHRQFLVFLERRTGNRAIAEDILQEAFVRSLDKVDSIRQEESVTAWFYRVLRNAVVDYQRRSKVAHAKLEAFAAALPQDRLADDDVQQAVCQCIARLTETLKPEYAEALRVVEVRGEPVKDFARSAGISAANARVRLFRAREALRKQVLRSCGACATHGCIECSCASTHETDDM